jgi:predicted nucleotidyltransferase
MNPALNVPTIDKRKRIPAAAIRAVTRQIAEKFKPKKIILFGSYARGNPGQYSDVDLLIIMESPVKSLEIRRYLGVMFGLDLLVYTPKLLKERVKMGDSFIQDILREGKILYESPGH